MAFLNHVGANLSSEDILHLSTGDVTDLSAAAKVLKIIPLAIVMLASIVGNAIVIHAVYLDVRMQTATNMLIVSQSLSDFGTSVLVIPFTLVSVGADGWILGERFCIANAFFNLFFTQVTVLQLAIIAFDRYLVIVKPLLRAIKSRDAIKLVVSAWVVGFFGAFPWLPLLTNHVKVEYFPGFHVCGQRYLHPLGDLALFNLVFLLLVYAVLPLFIILYCYYQIGKVIHRNNQSVSPLALSNSQKLAMNVFASSASTSKIVIGTSLIQVFPACFVMLLDGLQVGDIPYGLETALKWIMWCHCVVKPIIYASKSPMWTEIVRKYLNKFPFCTSIFGIKFNNSSIAMFANRFKQYRLSKRNNEKSLESQEESSKGKVQSEQKIKNVPWLITAKEAWLANAVREPDDFSAF